MERQTIKRLMLPNFIKCQVANRKDFKTIKAVFNNYIFNRKSKGKYFILASTKQIETLKYYYGITITRLDV